MIKCIIVEDETLAQNVIQSHLQKTEQFELVGVCNNALEAKEVLNKHEVDLIFFANSALIIMCHIIQSLWYSLYDFSANNVVPL